MTLDALRAYEIPGRVIFVTGEAGLPKAVVSTAVSQAEVYLHGAHVTQFQVHGDAPLLYLSRSSGFGPGVPIRGGVPICHPWFGPRDGGPAHGLARLVEWRVTGTSEDADGAVTIRFGLPPLDGEWASLETAYVVTVSRALSMTMSTTNSGSEAVRIESCLHTYLHVGDIGGISLTGLRDAPFDDFAFGAAGVRRVEHDSVLRIVQETNRVYPDNASAVEIDDPALGRIVRVEKSGSQSTVVWNPWTTQKMPADFDQADHRHMVCVESGNVKRNAVWLDPAQTTTMRATVSSRRRG